MEAQPSADLLAVATESPPVTPLDRLEKVRDRLARVRDLRLLVAELTERVTAANKEIQELTFTELPDAYAELGLRTLNLQATGNLPAVNSEVKPYYKANIAADWAAEDRERGFKTLESLEAEHLIKSKITVELQRGDIKTARKIMAGFDKAKIPYVAALSVHHGTLTAWLCERYTKKLGDLTPGQLEAIGGRVATVVEVKVGES